MQIEQKIKLLQIFTNMSLEDKNKHQNCFNFILPVDRNFKTRLCSSKKDLIFPQRIIMKILYERILESGRRRGY